MKLLAKLMVGFLLVASVVNINAQDKEMSKETLECLVKQYHDRQIKVFQKGSTVKEIDSIFELMTADFTYIHPKYGGLYSRKVLYNGYVRNQKNGGYNGRVQNIKINKTIIGLNAVVIETQNVLKDPKTGEISVGEEHMTLFDFKDGKISRIFEYW